MINIKNMKISRETLISLFLRQPNFKKIIGDSYNKCLIHNTQRYLNL